MNNNIINIVSFFLFFAYTYNTSEASPTLNLQGLEEIILYKEDGSMCEPVKINKLASNKVLSNSSNDLGLVKINHIAGEKESCTWINKDNVTGLVSNTTQPKSTTRDPSVVESFSHGLGGKGKQDEDE